MSGADHDCALIKGGAVRCWGLNFAGQLGDGSKNDSPVPVSVAGLGPARSVAAAGNTGCALTTAGQVVCWGKRREADPQRGGSVGLNAIAGATGARAFSVSATPTVCALFADGGVRCQGVPPFPPVAAEAVPVPGLVGAVALAGGRLENCALMPDRGVRCLFDYDDARSPVSIPGIGAQTILPGELRSCALTTNGSLSCWSYMQGVPSPLAAVTTMTGLRAAAVGARHICVLTSDGTVLCWGDNFGGQLGNGTRTASATPVPVVAP